MEVRTLTVGVISFAMFAGAGVWAVAQPVAQPPVKPAEKVAEKSDEQVIPFAKAPEAVRAAALKVVGAGGEKAIKKVIKEEGEGDVYTYEIEYTVDGVDCAAIFSTAGDVMEMEKGVKESTLPAAVAAALKKEYPKATIKNPNSVQKFYYEVDVVIDGKSHGIKVDAAGNIEDDSKNKGEKEKDEKAEKGEKHEKAAKHEDKDGAKGDDGFRKEFAAAKPNLGPTGASAYFDLTPGTVHEYLEGKNKLTITVLNETRVIDGVTTRIIEERETAGGKPKETSRNFFAIDKTNTDVYYLGEEVDVFDADGKVTHPGAWKSGEHGATYGLMIPGAPKMGDKFYQELAPGQAMDRFEIVSMEETLETPAGKFEHVVHVKETTPLEPDVGHKWYAKGVGLIKDGESVLVKHTAGKR